MRGSGVDTLSLYQKITGQQQKLIWKLVGSQTSKDEWRRAAIAIDSTDFYTLILEGKAFGNGNSDIAIDDIVIQFNQYCKTDPTEADVESVTFSMTSSTRTPPHNNNSKKGQGCCFFEYKPIFFYGNSKSKSYPAMLI